MNSLVPHNKTYQSVDKVGVSFWKELRVRVGALDDYSVEVNNKQFKSICQRLTKEELLDLLTVLKIKELDEYTVEQEIGKLESINIEQKKLILKINDFLYRKRTALTSYYTEYLDSFDEKVSYPIAQAWQLFHQDPTHLAALHTFHLWFTRSSGELYTLDKSIPKETAFKTVTEKGYYDKLRDELYHLFGQENKFRLFSYCNFNKKRIIALWYKQINDITRPDFTEAIRNQEVEEILFEIDLENNTVEIRGKSKKINDKIKQFLENSFNGFLTIVKNEPFSDYDTEKIKESFLKGIPASDEYVDDFIVDKIHFRTSPLRNAPELTFKTDKRDVWESVKHANILGAIHLESIKDVAQLTISTDGLKRVVRSELLNNGNILFTMEDSRLDETRKNLISSKFQKKFGVPLFQEISNVKFKDGQADVMNYVMQQTNPKNITYFADEIYQNLLRQNLMAENESMVIYCKSCNFESELKTNEEIPKECDCEGDLKTKKVSTLSLVMPKIKEHVKEILRPFCKEKEWILARNKQRTIGSEKYEFYHLQCVEDRRSVFILVTEEPISKQTLNRWSKQMVPTIIVACGSAYSKLENYSNDCIQSVSFGELIVLKNDEQKVKCLANIIDNLESLMKTYVASAASIAHVSLAETIKSPDEISDKYGENDLEDDVFAILKDLFPNAIKWGKEKTAKAVPEGIFAISYKKKRDNQYENFAFSYDCKFTRKIEGYDLNKSEKRKAVDYVKNLSDKDDVSGFTNKQYLDAHLFISNREFSQAKINGMIGSFKDELNYYSKPVFITTDVLMYLFEEYRKNYQSIHDARRVFLEVMKDLLLPEDNVVKREHVDKAIKRTLKNVNREIELMDMDELSSEVS